MKYDPKYPSEPGHPDYDQYMSLKGMVDKMHGDNGIDINSGAVTGWTDSGAIGSYTINVSTAPIPEPETWALFGAALLGLVTRLRRQPRKSRAARHQVQS